MQSLESMNKNVLFISDSSITNPILSSQGLPQLNLLSQKGFRIYVLSLETERDITISQQYKTLYQKFGNALILLPLRSRTIFPFAYSIQRFIFRMFFILYCIIKYDIRLIHSRSYVPAVFGLLFQKMLGIKFIFDMRGLLIDESISIGLWKDNSFNVKLMRVLEKYCILNANSIVVVSEQFRQHILNLPYAVDNVLNIAVIPTCAERERFEIGKLNKGEIKERTIFDNKIVFLYSGSLTEWQLANEVVRFFTYCFKKNPKSFFLILTYDEPLKMKTYLINNGISEENFLFIKASFDDVPKYFSFAHIGILLRKQELLNRVSCPIKFGEYLTAGIPVVLTKGIGDTEELLSKYNIGVLISELNETEYINASEKVFQLLEDTEVKVRCKNIARKYFSIETSVQQYYQIYSQLLS